MRVACTVTNMETLQTVLGTLADHGDTPALVVLQKDGIETRSFAQLASASHRLAMGLVKAGLQPGEHVVLFAPNRPEWIVGCFAIIAAASVPVLIDAQMEAEELQHVLDDSQAGWVFTTARLAQRLEGLDRPHKVTCVLLDVDQENPRSWLNYLVQDVSVLPAARPEDCAVLFYTSGTTGSPKGVPLTHRNLSANLAALLNLGLIHADDRLFLPLPLHHVYAFTIGLLAPLSAGIPIVLPRSLTGPQILRALREGRATIILGVPRLHAALYSAIETQVKQRGRLAAAFFFGSLAASILLRRKLGLRLGPWLFAILHRQFAPHVRMVVSGGAALDPQLAWKLEGLGWQVASGYGLTETSPILTFHSPGECRLDTVGKPLPGVSLRIAQPQYQIESAAAGEVQARGPNVFAGYRHLPVATHAVFTSDGYFRTGDVGYCDTDHYLHLVGRASELIVLPGGENIRPEDVEDMLARERHIREAGVFEDRGRLVALLVPEANVQHTPDTELAALIRHDVEHVLRLLPSHHRISDYALSFDPLPRTRLGKLRRTKLGEYYRQGKQRGEAQSPQKGPLSIAHMSPEDRQLLEDPTARRVWDWLVQRFPNARLTPEANLQLDLGVDSLEWLNLTLELRAGTTIDLPEEAIGRLENVRDLLREAIEADAWGEHSQAAGQLPFEQLAQPEALLSAQQRAWLQPPGPLIRSWGALLFAFDRWLMRRVYQLEIRGQEHLSQSGPCIVTPNHVSWLDPLVVAAALPQRVLEQTYWGGWTGILFANPLMRLLSRAARIVPIDAQHSPVSSLAFGAAALVQGYNLVWFPEGGLSHTGRLQRFRPGIGMLAATHLVPIIPARISGTYEALPYNRRWPRVRRLSIVFDAPLDPQELQRYGQGEHTHERITTALYEAMRAKADKSPPG